LLVEEKLEASRDDADGEDISKSHSLANQEVLSKRCCSRTPTVLRQPWRSHRRFLLYGSRPIRGRNQPPSDGRISLLAKDIHLKIEA
jgi:hypothetical protein